MPGGYPEDDHGYRRQVWRGDRHLVILPVGVKAVLLVVPAGSHLDLRKPLSAGSAVGCGLPDAWRPVPTLQGAPFLEP